MEIQKVIHNLCAEQNQKDFNSSVLLNSEYKLLGWRPQSSTASVRDESKLVLSNRGRGDAREFPRPRSFAYLRFLII